MNKENRENKEFELAWKIKLRTLGYKKIPYMSRKKVAEMFFVLGANCQKEVKNGRRINTTSNPGK